MVLDRLMDELRVVQRLQGALSLLHWDQQTHMPPGGAEGRAEQIALLSRLEHERFTAPKIGQLLEEAAGSAEMSDRAGDLATTVRETRRRYDRATRLPGDLVAELARTGALAESAWREARRNNHFPTFAPFLQKMLELKRQEADCYQHPGTRYDALLQDYEPGATTASLAAMLEELREPLVKIIEAIQGSGRHAPTHLLRRPFPIAAQEALGLEAARAMGFDFQRGRLDVSAHPFCTSFGAGDIRLTTRYQERFFADSFFSVMHEAGHGLYEQNLPAQWYGTPCGSAVSMGVHESQSRLWENLVGRSEPFWRFFLPRMKRALGGADDISLEQWCFAINNVEATLIRTESDELTYNLHILLRFELEQALLSGDLAVNDLPTAWNEKMRQYLRVEVPRDADGCLQDIHWSGGAIGYFATYTLGNLYAAQLMEALRRDIGGLDEMIAGGNLLPIRDWLIEKIHRHGQRYKADDLITRATGSAPSAQYLLQHLRRKAQRWYGV